MLNKQSPRLLLWSGLLFSSLLWLANNSNPPNGRTGAPFDSTCGTSNCHGTSNQNGYGASLSLDGLPATIQPNTLYPLTLTVTVSSGSPSKAGFQLVAVSTTAETNAGDLASTDTQTGTETFGGREYIEQRNGKAFSGGTVSWSFNWTSPASVSGNSVTFYFISLLANGNGSSSGDFPVNTSVTVPFSGPPPVVATITNITNVACFGGNTGSATVEGSGGIAPYTYKWSNNQTSATAVNLVAGNYTVTVTGSGSSGSATAVATITQPTSPISASASVNGSITCINQSVVATVTASGGTSPYSYAWPDGQTGNQATLTSAGTYVPTVTDNNGCTKTTSVTVTGNTTPPLAAASASGSISCNNPTTTLSCSGSSSGANFSLLWTTTNGNIVSGATSCNPVVNSPGEYVLKVTNTTNGCTATASATVTSTVVPPGATANGGTITCTNNNVTLQGNSSTQNVTFAWSGPNGYTSNLQNPVVSVSGNYVLTVTNPANGCTSTASATVAQNTTAPTATATSGPVLTCAQTSSQVLASTNGSNPTYLWSGPNNFTSTLQNPTVTLPGTYVLTVTNTANGCTNTASTLVAQDIALPSVTATAGPSITCLQTNSQVFATSVPANATYAWTGPNNFNSTQQNPMVAAAGSYKVTVTATGNGCTNTATATVALNQTPPGATATGGVLTCVVSQVTLQGSSSGNQVSYSWAGPGGYSSNIQNPVTTVAGAYNLTTTDGLNGCTSTASVSVTQNIVAPIAAASVPGNLNCNNASIQINGAGSSQGANFTYAWTTANGNIVSGANTLTPVVNLAGTYNLLVSNTENGCTQTTTATVLQTPVLGTVVSVSGVLCNGGNSGSAGATPTGGAGPYSYIWSNGASTAGIGNLSAGTYVVTVTDVENCTATNTAVVSQPNALLANAVATGETAIGANNGTASAAPSGGSPNYSYLWSNAATTSAISNLAPGAYTVTVTDNNGCTAVQTVTVNSFNCNLTTSLTTTAITCNGANNGALSVNISGAANPVSYTWSNGATTASINNLAPGIYTVQLLDGNGCPATLNSSLQEPSVLAANASSTGETATGANNGTASAAPSGGTLPYTYLWSNNSTSSQISNLTPGDYTVTVTDGNGCTKSQTVSVAAFNCVISADPVTTNVLCNGGSNGAITVAITGGTLPFSYVWSNGATTASIVNLSAGTYTVTITDAANCILIKNATVNQPPAISVNATVQNVICSEDKNGSVVLTGTGGTTPYIWNFPGGGNGQNLGIGVYTVTVTDANACSKLVTFEIKATDNIPPTITCPANITVCGQGVVNFANPVVTDNCLLGPNPAQLTGGLPSGSIFPVGVTTIQYKASDVLGNTAVCSFNVSVLSLPTIDSVKITNDLNNTKIGSIDISVGGGNGSFVYEWTKNGVLIAQTQDITGLEAGNYVVKITDAAGCSTVSISYTVSNTTASAEPGSGIRVQLVPNPVFDQFTLVMSEFEVIRAGIFDNQGKFVKSIQSSELKQAVPVGDLQAGIYYLQMISEKGQVHVIKWIKQD